MNVFDTSIYSSELLNSRGEFTISRFKQCFLEAVRRALEQQRQEPLQNGVAWKLRNGAHSNCLPFGTLAERTRSWEAQQEISDFDDEGADILLDPSNKSAFTDSPTASRLGNASLPKIKLVLDLDNTLLNAYSTAKISNLKINMSDFVDADNMPELFQFSLPQMRGQVYYVKFRPRVREFFRDLYPYCDFAIHTNARREYADVMLSILDPDRIYVGNRVAARDDDSTREMKKDMEKLFEACRSAVSDGRDLLILDDRKDVWHESLQPNLIRCSFYEFFEVMRPSLLQRYGSNNSPDSDTDNNRKLSDSAALGNGDPTANHNPIHTSRTASTKDVNSHNNTHNNTHSNLRSPNMTSAPEDRTSSPGSSYNDSAPNSRDTSANQEDSSNSDNRQTTNYDSLDDLDMELYFLKNLFMRIAQEYRQRLQNNNNGQEVNVVDILSHQRQHILSDVTILLTGFNKRETSSDHGQLDSGPQHRKRLEALGATVTDSVDHPNLTHVLVIRNTFTADNLKVERENDNLLFVHSLWLAGCETLWTKLDESCFESVKLLQHFNGLPPTRPFQDHWQFTIQQFPNLMPIRQQHNNNNNNNVGDATSIKEPNTANTMSQTLNSDTSPSNNLSRQWLVTTPLSDGAEVWTPTHHTTLKYDLIKSGHLVQDMRRRANAGRRNINVGGRQHSKSEPSVKHPVKSSDTMFSSFCEMLNCHSKRRKVCDAV